MVLPDALALAFGYFGGSLSYEPLKHRPRNVLPHAKAFRKYESFAERVIARGKPKLEKLAPSFAATDFRTRGCLG